MNNKYKVNNAFDALPSLSFSFNHLFYLSITRLTLLIFIPIFLSSPFFAAFNVRFMLFSLFSPDPCVPLQISEHAQWDGEPGFSWWRSSKQVGQNHALLSFLWKKNTFLPFSWAWVKKDTLWNSKAQWKYLDKVSHSYVKLKEMLDAHVKEISHLGRFCSLLPGLLFERLPINCMCCPEF